jgi:hypothetical protein
VTSSKATPTSVGGQNPVIRPNHPETVSLRWPTTRANTITLEEMVARTSAHGLILRRSGRDDEGALGLLWQCRDSRMAVPGDAPPRASGVEEGAPISLTHRRVSLHATSKGWTIMTVGRRIEGAGLFVV